MRLTDDQRALIRDTVAASLGPRAEVRLFGSRTLGDKLLPALLVQLGEPRGSAIDNLDRAERLGLVLSTEHWLQLRRLRNRMVHEYVRDPAELAAALEAGHAFVPLPRQAAEAIVGDVRRRFGAG